MSLQKTRPKKSSNKPQKRFNTEDANTSSIGAVVGGVSAVKLSEENRTSTPTAIDTISPNSEDESFDAVVPISISPVRPTTSTSISRPIVSAGSRHALIEPASKDFADLGEIVEIDPDAINYEPPDRSDDLPNLIDLIDTLDQDAPDEFEGKDIPIPSLFADNAQITNYGNIYDLKQDLETESITDYVDCFNKDVKSEVLMIGQISLQQVQQEEQHIRDEHIRYETQEIERKKLRELETLAKEDIAKKRVAQDLKSARQLISRKENLQIQQEKLTTDRIHKTFRRAENQLLSALEKRKAEIKTTYGDLLEADGEYGGSKGRRWRIDWNKTPQPIEVKLKCLRGIKNKVPMGRYVCIVSLHNRLGGHVLRWSKLKGQQWSASTMPVRHDAKFYNTEIKFHQSVFTALPSMANIRPGMVLVFELFLLRGSSVATDKCVSWGVFPVADGKFQVIEGKFKVPMLRGETSPLFDNHMKIESLMASDLDHWMCNLYIEIVKLPRYLAGQKEYEVELQFSSGVLAHPDRVNTFGEQYRDGAPPMSGSKTDMANELALEASDTSEILQLETDGSEIDELVSSNNLKVAPSSSGLQILTEPTATSPEDSFLFTNDSLISQDLQKTGSSSDNNTDISKSTKIKNINNNNSTDESLDGDDICLLKEGQGFYPVKGQSGLFYKKHAVDHIKNAHKKQVFQLLPQISQKQNNMTRRPLTYHEELDEHTFSVKQPLDNAGQLEDISHVQMQYLGRQFVAEIGISEWRSRYFWTMLCLLALVFFLRLYLHYVSQWVYLRALNIPINKMEFLTYTVNLNYQNTLLQATEEVSIILIGSFSVILLFSLLVFVHWVLQRVVGAVPDIGSQFILIVGVEAFLDPILIMIIDCIIGRYKDKGGDAPIADFMKLYYHYLRVEGSGLSGALIYVFLLFFSCFISICILYMYFLRLHNNGRLLDIYWRLHGEETTFHIPLDLEVSNEELAAVLKSSEDWRGEQGERRKTAVYDYVWEQEKLQVTIWDLDRTKRKQEVDRFREVTTHIAVHTLHLDGLRELYRHWLRTPNGAIVEVFGDMAISGMSKEVEEVLSYTKEDDKDLNTASPPSVSDVM